uniref:Uncharacterized protein n=1 Tax=uncultured myxobacterium HF0130_06F04 TaxID=723555 RepID=E7C2E4_9BACT|nr:hypothetical protein [uncultured myxobacterium HF0130_06F04]
MKSHRIRSLKELISTAEFTTWHAKHNELNRSVLELEEKREELELALAIARFETEFIQGNADQTFLSAGDFEDESARSEAEYAAVENDSFQLLSDFEDKSRDEETARIDLHGLETQLEEKRGQTSELKAQATADEKQGSESSGISDEELKNLGGDIAGLARQVEAARARLSEEVKRREALWDEVEQTWVTAFRANMRRSEFSYQGRRVRARAERLFTKAEMVRRRVDDLSAQMAVVDEKLSSAKADNIRHLDHARKTFDCTVVDEFLFWPHSDDVQAALCVPLVDEQSHFNIQIKALKVYQIERDKGLDFIEPVSDEELGDEDPRLESFFNEGRPAA